MEHFPVIAIDGVTKESGVSAFTTTVWHNGVVSAVPVVVAEIGTSGEYTARLTPTDVGAWGLEILIDSNGDRLGADIVVSRTPIQWGLSAADDATEFTASIWADIDGEVIADFNTLTAVVRSQSGTIALNLGTPAGPDARGVYRFTADSGDIPSGDDYYLHVTGVRGTVTWQGRLGFAKV
jgi:hypothetical protein